VSRTVTSVSRPQLSSMYPKSRPDAASGISRSGVPPTVCEQPVTTSPAATAETKTCLFTDPHGTDPRRLRRAVRTS
jgi:hypothetical protein